MSEALRRPKIPVSQRCRMEQNLYNYISNKVVGGFITLEEVTIAPGTSSGRTRRATARGSHSNHRNADVSDLS